MLSVKEMLPLVALFGTLQIAQTIMMPAYGLLSSGPVFQKGATIPLHEHPMKPTPSSLCSSVCGYDGERSIASRNEQQLHQELVGFVNKCWRFSKQIITYFKQFLIRETKSGNRLVKAQIKPNPVKGTFESTGFDARVLGEATQSSRTLDGSRTVVRNMQGTKARKQSPLTKFLSVFDQRATETKECNIQTLENAKLETKKEVLSCEWNVDSTAEVTAFADQLSRQGDSLVRAVNELEVSKIHHLPGAHGVDIVAFRQVVDREASSFFNFLLTKEGHHFLDPSSDPIVPQKGPFPWKEAPSSAQVEYAALPHIKRDVVLLKTKDFAKRRIQSSSALSRQFPGSSGFNDGDHVAKSNGNVRMSCYVLYQVEAISSTQSVLTAIQWVRLNGRIPDMGSAMGNGSMMKKLMRRTSKLFSSTDRKASA